MKNTDIILASARKTIFSERDSINLLADFLDFNFVEATQKIFDTKGRIVISGIGKSAIIAQKIVATFNSTGTPAVFLHAADAIHGDLGMIQKGDVVICISKSGNSPEIKTIVPLLKRFGNFLIAITGNTNSFLAKEAHFVLNSTVKKESCPNNLAPTNSTTAQLVLGDALAVCLMELRNFNSDNFAANHPGGALGKKLRLYVKDLITNSSKSIVSANESLKNIIVEILEKRMSATAVIDNNKIIGIITHDNIREVLNQNDNISKLTAIDIMTKNTTTIQYSALATEAKNILEKNSISQLVVVDNEEYKGIIDIKDILKEEIE